MQDTLAALHAAVIADPTDRTVRLVYADALDESGDPAHAARAEFVRAQIAFEALSEADPARAAGVARCEELFAAHWTDWWRPVCAAVGLPEPYVPKRRLRDRVKRLVRTERRPVGAPYVRSADTPGAFSISSDELGFTAQFIAGFPELLYVREFPPEAIARWLSLADYFSRWIGAVPLARIRFGMSLHDSSWRMLDGPHLERVADLSFDGLMEPTAQAAARSSHLQNLSALKVRPTLNPAADVVRPLIDRPMWTGLRSLTLAGVTPPDAIRVIAERCTLAELEELTFGIAEVPEPHTLPGVGGMIGAAIAAVSALAFPAFSLPTGPVRWPDYWPVLTALARSPVVARLRTLRIHDAHRSATDILRHFLRRAIDGHPPQSPEQDSIFPDTLVRALADGLNPDRLVRLELPAARLALASRAELTHRFGSRFVPV